MPAKRKTPPTDSSHPPQRKKRARRRPKSQNEQTTSESSGPESQSSDALGLDPEAPEVVKTRPYSGPKSRRTQLALDLPPLYKLSDIYKSLTGKALDLGFDDVLSHLCGRALRVVTVCSGTESPLLALEMVRDNLRKHFDGRIFEFRHLFSAEIVPFKQAYIERNFHPRFIFRDVAELKDRVAQTAYGSLEKIPKNADILIAGFSCVDFSGLNNKRKTLDEKGESGGTFWGIIRYAKTYRPRMVILENVKTAPWEKIKQHWNEIDYFAVHVDVDTKAYYLPQTRERGYMFCVDRKLMQGLGLSEEEMMVWRDTFGHFKRPASSPAGMFLMDADDRRLEQIEKDMAVRIASSSRTTVNWAKYQVRHQSYRLNQNLGHRRPVSKSQDDGTCQMPDFAWQTWVQSLPERVWDTIDVNFLRKLVDGYDMNYKERCIELSQGIDREIDSRAYGVVGCITPCGIPYITTRGGPLCGLESLSLQGLPLDRLLLSRESQRELQDLAGNAMSSTVVGAAVLAALIVGHKVLEKGEQASTPRKARHRYENSVPQDEERLMLNNPQVRHVVNIGIEDIQVQATQSARYCVCERQSAFRRNISRCTLCGHTACSECSGNPPHAYERFSGLIRSPPLDFVSKLRGILPARLVISGISRDSYNAFRDDSSIKCPENVWEDLLQAITLAVGDELRFLDIKRSEAWTAVYEGRYAILNLIIAPAKVEWLFFAKPSDDEPSLCLNREILSKPIARMVPSSESLLEGRWEVCAPLSSMCTLSISGTGNQVQAYEAKCGLDIEEFATSKVWSQIEVQGSDQDVKGLEVDIRGTYDLLPDCGTANACLHKRPATEGAPAVYLFLDPTKLGEPKYDSFVFSLEHRRIPSYSSRLTIAEVSHKWRSSKVAQSPEMVSIYYRKWCQSSEVTLEPFAPRSPITYYTLDPGSTLSISRADCHDANITLVSFVAPAETIGSLWNKGPWEITDPLDSPSLLRDFSWLLQKAASLSVFRDWNEVEESTVRSPNNAICSVCVPPKPRILWGRNARGWITAYEDPQDAALYERQVKSRPPLFLIFRRVDEHGFGILRVTLNVQSLLHQAYDRLIGPNTADGVSFHWRLIPKSYDSRDLVFPKFCLTSNRNDAQFCQPPSFMLNLRPEQLRSLSWMIKQEENDIEPFTEEEIEEALLPSLLWRAEGRASVQKVVRGGVLADDVGYGKTAIILGLIDAQFERGYSIASQPLSGFIPTKATLIVVPHIMLQQWQSEIVKFLGTRYKVLVLQTVGSFVKTTIRDVRDSDIILVSWSVFNNTGYYQKMQKFTGMPRLPARAGRNFDDWFLQAQASLKRQVQTLMDQGPRALLESIHAMRQDVKDKQANGTYVPSKRLRGQKYAVFKQAQEDTEIGTHYADVSSADEGVDSSDDEDPYRVRAKVAQLFKHRSADASSRKEMSDLNGPVDAESEDEDTEYDDSPESIAEQEKVSEGNSRNKRKLGKSTASNKPGKTWDDRKEFNINDQEEQQGWETVTTPLLHAFSFNRLVIDEFTYANSERLSPLLALEARSKWVLSGTPPLNDFADVKTIAPFLGIHLGIDDDDVQSQNRRLKILNKQRSEAEAFQSFRTPRSEAWHRRRHQVAQLFLDRFARRNVAEIDEIPSTEHIILVVQSPAEKTIYLELYKQLMTHNRQLRRSGRGRFSSDQLDRLDEIIGSSATAEEALIKRCSSLALHGRWDDGKSEETTCRSLMEIREKQMNDHLSDFLKMVKLAAWVYCRCDLRHEKFHKFIESIMRHDFGDKIVTEKAYPLLKRAIFTSSNSDCKLFFTSPQDGSEDYSDDSGAETQTGSGNEDGGEADNGDSESVSVEKAKAFKVTAKAVRNMMASKASGKDESPTLPEMPTQVKEFEPLLREITTAIRNLIVEWVLRERSLRFLKTVRLVQTCSEVPTCNSCQNKPDKISDINILGSCGHALCSSCIANTAQTEECNVEECHGSGKKFNIINGSTLGRDEEDKSAKYGGSKMDKMIQIIQNIPTDERVLLFIQFPELMDVASKALDMAGIKHTAISTADRKSSQKIERFQKTRFGEDKVLILNLGTEMAAGLNLQCANHVIFLSPMFTQTQYDYDSTMTQAIGRSRRYGQTKHVHVYHLLAKMTIDVNIFQDRREKILIERDGEPVLVCQDDALDSEAVSCQGPSLVVDNAF